MNLGRKPRIVLVDDDHKFLRLMEYIAIQRGILVTAATDLDDLDVAALRAADVIAVDFDLGVGNGVELAAELERRQIDTPVVIVSASQNALRLSRWPAAIRGFASKDLGPFDVLDSILAAASDAQALMTPAAQRSISRVL